MLIRKAEAKWRGNLVQGSGRLTVGSGAIDVPYSFKSRLEDGQSATNPEELLGAAHAGCFTMALAAQLSGAGFMPSELDTVAKGSFEKVGNNFQITRIELETSGNVPGARRRRETKLSGVKGSRRHRNQIEGDTAASRNVTGPNGRCDTSH